MIDAVKAKLEALAQEPGRAQLAAIEGGAVLASRGLLARTLCLLTAMIDEHGWLTAVQRGRFALPAAPAWTDLKQMKNHEIGIGETRDSLLALSWQLMRLAVGRFALRLLVAPGERDNERQYADGREFGLNRRRTHAAAFGHPLSDHPRLADRAGPGTTAGLGDHD